MRWSVLTSAQRVRMRVVRHRHQGALTTRRSARLCPGSALVVFLQNSAPDYFEMSIECNERDHVTALTALGLPIAMEQVIGSGSDRSCQIHQGSNRRVEDLLIPTSCYVFPAQLLKSGVECVRDD